MSAPRIYVASSYETAEDVRDVHDKIVLRGMVYTSDWAEYAKGHEDFSTFTSEELRGFAEANDRNIQNSDALLVISREAGGRETYAEVRYALTLSLPVFWVGRHTLSAYRFGVTRCSDVEDAIDRIMQTFGVEARRSV